MFRCAGESVIASCFEVTAFTQTSLFASHARISRAHGCGLTFVVSSFYLPCPMSAPSVDACFRGKKTKIIQAVANSIIIRAR